MQSNVAFDQGFGVIGEVISSQPIVAGGKTLFTDTVDVTNKYGNAFTYVDRNLTPDIVMAGGTGRFAGILVNPKTGTNYGDLSNPLSPSLDVPNNATGELLREGEIVVYLASAYDIDDSVVFDQTTGELSAIAPDATVDAGYTLAQATVTRNSSDAAGLATIWVRAYPTQNTDTP